MHKVVGVIAVHHLHPGPVVQFVLWDSICHLIHEREKNNKTAIQKRNSRKRKIEADD